MQEAWDAFFDDHYLRTYAAGQDPEVAAEQALAAARLAGCEPGSLILDMPCGYGRHSIPLARAGYRVVGADRSQVLVDEARRRAGDIEGLELVQADYREIPYPDRRFDAVLNLFTSLGYYGKEDDTRALAEFRRVLRPGGRLVVETMHRDRLVRIFQERGWQPLPDGSRILEERSFDPVRGVNETALTYAPPDGPSSTFTYRLRVYTATELCEMLEEAGFADIACYGDLEGGTLSWETRLVAVAG